MSNPTLEFNRIIGERLKHHAMTIDIKKGKKSIYLLYARNGLDNHPAFGNAGVEQLDNDILTILSSSGVAPPGSVNEEM